MFEELDKAIAEMERSKKSFEENHKILKDALGKAVADITADLEKLEEIGRQQEKINAELDELLSSF